MNKNNTKPFSGSPLLKKHRNAIKRFTMRMNKRLSIIVSCGIINCKLRELERQQPS